MTTYSDPAPVRVSHGIYRILLYAYPASFRRAYQGQMASLFRDDCRARYREGGAIGLLDMWAHALGDLGANIPKEYATVMQQKPPEAKPGRICSSCSSEIMDKWTTCLICGSLLTAGMTREGHTPPKKTGFQIFADGEVGLGTPPVKRKTR